MISVLKLFEILYCYCVPGSIDTHGELTHNKQIRRWTCVKIEILNVYEIITFIGFKNPVLNFLCFLRTRVLINHFLVKNM